MLYLPKFCIDIRQIRVYDENHQKTKPMRKSSKLMKLSQRAAGGGIAA